MLQLSNRTPFVGSLNLLPDEKGIDTLYVIAKATFRLGKRLIISEEQMPVRGADEYWGEPGASSLKYVADVHLTKRATDVALVGSAHAPHHRPVTYLDVSLSVADVKKSVRVFGDRTWTGSLMPPTITPPKPFETMPLRYERAYGGVHVVDAEKGEILYEPRNPVGCGFTGKRKRPEVAGLPLPNLEDPASMISERGDQGTPAGFGFVAPSWEPRKSYAGTYDEAWKRGRAPFLPADFDPRFFNASPPDLVAKGYLRGGEPVQVVNASAEGILQFKLPAIAITATVFCERRAERPGLNVETVLIEPDESRLVLVWRTSFPCDKKGLKVREVVLEAPESDLAEHRG